MKQALNNKKTKNIFKIIPWWGWVGAAIFSLFHPILYLSSTAIVKTYGETFVLSYCPKVGLDNAIPFCPYFFSQMYYVAYAVYFIVPLMISITGKKNMINFIIYTSAAYFVGACLFLILPSWQDRVAEGIVAPEGGPGQLIQNIKGPFTKWMMTIIVGNDGGAKTWNMAPSFHILSSLFCIFGIMRMKQLPIWSRLINYGVNIIIGVGTLFIKQHYIFDIFFAVALGGLIYIIVIIFNPGNVIMTKYPDFLNIKKHNKNR